MFTSENLEAYDDIHMVPCVFQMIPSVKKHPPLLDGKTVFNQHFFMVNSNRTDGTTSGCQVDFSLAAA